MDPLEEFLSPEALRLLLDSDDFATRVDEPSVTTSDRSLSITTPVTAAANIPIPNKSKPTRKRPASDANIPGCSTLVLDKAGSAKHKRAKFNAEGRAKVASVRKKGACMKCHRNKIPCSGEWPCESCCRSRAVIAGRVSRHRWMDCIPFSMKDLDIFANGIVQGHYFTDESLRRNISPTSFALSCILLDDAIFSSTAKDFSTTFSFKIDAVQWPCSKKSISNRVDSRLGKASHLVIMAQLLTFNGNWELNNFGDFRAAAGFRLLQCLEEVLSNRSLAGFDADTLKTLIKILCLTIWIVISSSPSVRSLPEFDGRQQKQQLLRVLAHHTVYIGERVDHWKGLDKEKVIAGFLDTIDRYGDGNAQFFPEIHHFSFVRDYSQGETSKGISTPLDPRRGDPSQTTLYTEANPVSEQGNDRAIIQRNEAAKSAYSPDPPAEDRYWTVSDINEIHPTISTTTAGPLPEQQPDAVCGWCGSLQVSYKPSQGVVSCDDCFTPYQANDSTVTSWDFGHPQNTNQSSNPANGLDCSQGDLVNYTPWADGTTSNSCGGDIDDFSWFMAS